MLINEFQQARQKNISFKMEFENDLPEVWADIEKTTWVMSNLLSNALRYSPEDSPILISLKSKGKSVEFSVTDYGRGVPEKDKEKIFDKFFFSSEKAESHANSGLGLSIAKEYIEEQNGMLLLESEEGSYSRFYFLLLLVN